MRQANSVGGPDQLPPQRDLSTKCHSTETLISRYLEKDAALAEPLRAVCGVITGGRLNRAMGCCECVTHWNKSPKAHEHRMVTKNLTLEFISMFPGLTRGNR